MAKKTKIKKKVSKKEERCCDNPEFECKMGAVMSYSGTTGYGGYGGRGYYSRQFQNVTIFCKNCGTIKKTGPASPSEKALGEAALLQGN